MSTDKFPTCNRQQRSPGERPAHTDQGGTLPDCSHDRTVMRVLSSREAAIKSISAVSSSSSAEATHLSPDSSGDKSASIESPIS